MTPSGALDTLIASSRRRSIAGLLAEHLTLGASAGLLGLILLLLLGTQIMSWYWPPLLLAVVAGVAMWRFRKRVPSAYEVAQRVDGRLGLRDLLSTSVFFHLRRAGRHADPAFLSQVDRQAEAAAAAIRPEHAWPLRMPRFAWPALGLLLVAGTLIGVRYGVLHSFDFAQPLFEVNYDTLTGLPHKAPNRKLPKQPGSGDVPEPIGLYVDPPGTPETRDENDTAGLQDTQNIELGKNGLTQQSTNDQKQGESDEEGNENGEGAAGKDSENGSDRESTDKSALQPGAQKQSPKDGQAGQNKQDKNGLMDKLRDAMANMMEKLKISPKGGEQPQQSAQNKQGGQDQQSGQQGKQGKKEGQGDPDSQQPGDQPGDASDAAQSDKSNAGDQPDQSPNSKSGQGKMDGNKEFELAQQQEAMGKISEILGKRSEKLSGEMMIEVQSTKQQLKTPYTQRKAEHGEAGGEINRDEVPLDRQHYVQQYYEQVRKTAPTAKK